MLSTLQILCHLISYNYILRAYELTPHLQNLRLRKVKSCKWLNWNLDLGLSEFMHELPQLSTGSGM